VSVFIREKLFFYRRVNVLRKLFGKKIINNVSIDAILASKFRIDVGVETKLSNCRYAFYEYRFTHRQFKEELEKVFFSNVLETHALRAWWSRAG
jgi:hypothetical protein